MPSLNTVVKAARIKNEDWEIIEGYMGRNNMSFSGFVKECAEKISEKSVDMPFPADMVADFEVILALYDTDFESFFKALYKKVESMEIDVDEVMK